MFNLKDNFIPKIWLKHDITNYNTQINIILYMFCFRRVMCEMKHSWVMMQKSLKQKIHKAMMLEELLLILWKSCFEFLWHFNREFLSHIEFSWIFSIFHILFTIFFNILFHQKASKLQQINFYDELNSGKCFKSHSEICAEQIE